tara:strand:- start:914 stop:1117 length:204 start_codon:yes stop_codon:yes gene_type:complete
MPTYHYRCTTCLHEFDAVQSMLDSPLTDCPICSKNIIRIIQPVGIQFKGQGFYINDKKTPTKSSGNE